MDTGKKSHVAQKEEEILKFWQDSKIFETSLAKTKNGKPFVFYDGPPFATGQPHHGHLLAGTIKDAIPRYQTMKGRYVRRRWGWDCHGLPIENLIEKELGLKNKKDIENFGITNFNEKARDSILRYDADWKEIIPRAGRFIDMENSYKTVDWQYSESIWWAFKELYNKGLIYEGYKSMHICPRCETTLANSEVTLNYKDITDISVTAKFELVDEPNTFLLAWTTTPWTLPGNVALAVNPDIDYVKIEEYDGEKDESNFFILAKDIFNKNNKEEGFKELSILETPPNQTGKALIVNDSMKGKDLIGKKYKPVFDYYLKDEKIENKENGWKIYGADFVTTETGTGIVHIAPAFGEDDMELGKKHNLPFIQHVGMDGLFKSEVVDFFTKPVKPKENHQKADIEIIKNLAHRNLLFSKEKIIHSYPHCWRCDTPLLNYAANSWFVKVGQLKNKMIGLNKEINWIPETVGQGRFAKWLEGSRDWAISRSRFWGAPLPVWRCQKCEKIEVMGSIEEIKKRVFHSHNKYFAIRHGQAENNTRNILSSGVDDDIHLTKKGREDVLISAQKLKKENIDLIFYSDLVRTTETTQIIAKELGLEDGLVIIDERLREINMGDFNRMSGDKYHKYTPTYEEKFIKRIPGGESLMDVKKRVNSFLEEIDNKYKNKNILIISHEYPNWMMITGSQGFNSQESIKLREGREDFPNNSEILNINFSPFPHNENFELDLHRPYIDKIKLKCSCGSEMIRISEVFDCWFESGSMPYAQFHYPFENKKEFHNNFPADFIAEGLDQTRGWFYNMLVLSTGLFSKSAYENVVVNGLILAEDGQKMSKKLKNYPDPLEIINKYGADSLRYYMLSSPVVKGEDLHFSEKGVDEINKKIIGRLMNVYSFYELYKEKNDKKPETVFLKKIFNFFNITTMPKSKNILDQWIITRLNELIKEVSLAMDKYELDKATRPIALFVDDLSTWYLRRSRDRFKGENKKDKQKALQTTHFVLLELSKTMAPFMPFVSESLYQKLHSQKESVHLENWPNDGAINNNILKTMEEIRNIVSLGLEARSAHGIKVRQPLNELKIINYQVKESYQEILKNELNVKNILSQKGEGEIKVEIDIKITPELKKEGQYRELLRHIQSLRKKEELTPDDIVVLEIETNKEGQKLINGFEEELKKSSLLKQINIKKDLEKEEIKIDNLVFKLKIIHN